MGAFRWGDVAGLGGSVDYVAEYTLKPTPNAAGALVPVHVGVARSLTPPASSSGKDTEYTVSAKAQSPEVARLRTEIVTAQRELNFWKTSDPTYSAMRDAKIQRDGMTPDDVRERIEDLKKDLRDEHAELEEALSKEAKLTMEERQEMLREGGKPASELRLSDVSTILDVGWESFKTAIVGTYRLGRGVLVDVPATAVESVYDVIARGTPAQLPRSGPTTVLRRVGEGVSAGLQARRESLSERADRERAAKNQRDLDAQARARAARMRSDEENLARERAMRASTAVDAARRERDKQWLAQAQRQEQLLRSAQGEQAPTSRVMLSLPRAAQSQVSFRVVPQSSATFRYKPPAESFTVLEPPTARTATIPASAFPSFSPAAQAPAWAPVSYAYPTGGRPEVMYGAFPQVTFAPSQSSTQAYALERAAKTSLVRQAGLGATVNVPSIEELPAWATVLFGAVVGVVAVTAVATIFKE